ncbi:PREDICTED: serine/arginine-rich splicing factor RSZ22-like [Nicotiana attenuata]|uniref:serine/arginine-rich splicing factor RSZ22-like n=1 Tax=Nicotiana attenuata TaxID=49451 RepID=UPI000905A478|nr:PREDICTED: serine/arginine-rich splicing factor RSZ22-like [Nicotiana attenuata]
MLESSGVAFTTFQFSRAAFTWWEDLERRRPVGATPLTREREERAAKRPRGSGSFSGAPSRGQFQRAPGSCDECGEFGHMKRDCPRRRGGRFQQRDQSSSSTPSTSAPSQSGRGWGQAARGRPRGGDRSGGGQEGAPQKRSFSRKSEMGIFNENPQKREFGRRSGTAKAEAGPQKRKSTGQKG